MGLGEKPYGISEYQLKIMPPKSSSQKLGVYFGCLIIMCFPKLLHSAVSLLGTERVPSPAQSIILFPCSLWLLLKTSSLKGRKVIKRCYRLSSKRNNKKKRGWWGWKEGRNWETGENFSGFPFLSYSPL